MTTPPDYKTVQILPAFPEFAAFAQSLSLGPRTWTFEYEWRPRLRSWFASMYNDELEAVFRGRRVVVGSNLAYGVLDFPGALVVLGRNDTEQAALARDHQIFYVELNDD